MDRRTDAGSKEFHLVIPVAWSVVERKKPGTAKL